MSSVAISGGATGAPGPLLEDAYHSRFKVGDIAVELRGNSLEAVDLGPQLRPFTDGGDSCDIEVRVRWTRRLNPCAAREVFHSGSLWSAFELRGERIFDFTTERLGTRPYKRLIADANFERAQVVLSEECLAAENARNALEYPLDELLVTHYLSLGRGVELHACGMACAGGDPVLFVGHSGAGKSTTARLWKRHMPVEILSDDRIVVRRQGDEFIMYGTPWHGEAAFASPGQAPIRRIFLLEHGTGNRLERITRSAAVGELLARSFVPFYQHRFVDPVLALLEHLTESVPCYRFQFVPDASAVERIREFRD